jgi:hypothetical protein
METFCRGDVLYVRLFCFDKKTIGFTHSSVAESRHIVVALVAGLENYAAPDFFAIAIKQNSHIYSFLVAAPDRARKVTQLLAAPAP